MKGKKKCSYCLVHCHLESLNSGLGERRGKAVPYIKKLLLVERRIRLRSCLGCKAQNAGKSTFSNAMPECATGDERKVSYFFMEVPVPGTALGIVRVEGVLPGQAELFDSEFKSLEGKARISFSRRELLGFELCGSCCCQSW